MLGEVGDGFLGCLPQSGQSHSSAPPVEVVGEPSRRFAPGMLRGTAPDDKRLKALLLGRGMGAASACFVDGFRVGAGGGVAGFGSGDDDDSVTVVCEE